MTIKCTLCDIEMGTAAVVMDQLPFCCHGCKAVYTILLTKQALVNPRDNPIFQQALRSGVISNPLLLDQLQNRQTAPASASDVKRWHFEISEMWCPTCAELIRWIVLREKGVLHCIVDYATDIASVEFDSMVTSKASLTSVIEQLGYPVHPLDDSHSKPVPFDLYLRLAIAAFCSLNVMMLAYPLYATFFDSEDLGAGNLFAWISFFVSIPVLTYCAWPIFQKFINSVRVGLLGMETLVATGIIAATALSIAELWMGTNRVYFDSMTVIVVFVLLGKVLEARAKFSAKQAFLQLTRTLPRRGRKLIAPDNTQFVPIKEIEVGDTLVAFAGEKIVLDGFIQHGVGECDESVMTGEAMPVKKEPGDLVVAGTILLRGELHYLVNAPPENSLLSRIVEMTHTEIGKKQAYIRPADRIVQWFIPAVFAVASLTAIACVLFQVDDGHGVINTAILRATAVLLISCPCAIGIAAPIAEGHLISALAREGVIIRNRGVLSLLGKEDTYVFDKTGTVTTGKFRVSQGIETLSLEHQAILKAITSHSNHLACRAINETVQIPPSKGVEVQEIISKGMIGLHSGRRYLLGSRAFMLEQSITLKNPPRPGICYFACDGECLSEIRLGDTIREEIHDTLANLDGVWKVLLSGDHELAVQEVASVCSFDSFAWERTPDEKMKFVQNIAEKGHIVAVVGDGINDAPALTAAHVGISVVSASDISIQVSDILLTTPKLSIIPKMRSLAKFSRDIVNQNLFWAFFYNVAGVGLAVAGWLSPLYAAAAMVASSLMVILNARRIQ